MEEAAAATRALSDQAVELTQLLVRYRVGDIGEAPEVTVGRTVTRLRPVTPIRSPIASAIFRRNALGCLCAVGSAMDQRGSRPSKPLQVT